MKNKKNDKKEKQVKNSDNQKKNNYSGQREKNDTLKRSPKQEDL